MKKKPFDVTWNKVQSNILDLRGYANDRFSFVNSALQY